VTGDADDAVLTHRGARVVIGGVFLSHMNAIGSKFRSEVGPVVQDKGRAAALRDGHQDFARAKNLIVGNIFKAQLDARDVAAGKRPFQGIGKRLRLKLRRRDEIEATARHLGTNFEMKESQEYPPLTIASAIQSRDSIVRLFDSDMRIGKRNARHWVVVRFMPKLL